MQELYTNVIPRLPVGRALRLNAWLVVVVLLVTSGLHLQGQSGSDPDLAALKVKAEAGDAEAQYRFANTFKDRDDFEKWLRKSADQHHPPAMDQLAAYLSRRLFGRMTAPVSYEEGVIWAARAADHGIDRSVRLLVEAYYYGRGLESDHEKAYYWALIVQRLRLTFHNVSNIEERLLQTLPIATVRRVKDQAEQFEPGKGIAFGMVIGSVLTPELQFTGTMKRGDETYALVGGNLIGPGQDLTIDIDAGTFRLICLDVTPTQVRFSIEGVREPLVVFRHEDR